MSARLLSHLFSQSFISFFYIYMDRMAIVIYANLYKKIVLHVDNKGCVMNLRYIGYVQFLKENRIQN